MIADSNWVHDDTSHSRHNKAKEAARKFHNFEAKMQKVVTKHPTSPRAVIIKYVAK